NAQKVYFAGRFNRAAVDSGTWRDGNVSSARSADGDAGAWFHFPARTSVELQVAVSYVSSDGAHANLHAELDGKGFDSARLAAQAAWEGLLARARVDGGSDGDKTIFYTALYHALIHPSIASDVDGKFR